MGNSITITENGYGVASFAKGGAFLFDIADLPLIQRHTWHLGKRGYPATHIRCRTVVLHRLLFSEAGGRRFMPPLSPLAGVQAVSGAWASWSKGKACLTKCSKIPRTASKRMTFP